MGLEVDGKKNKLSTGGEVGGDMNSRILLYKALSFSLKKSSKK